MENVSRERDFASKRRAKCRKKSKEKKMKKMRHAKQGREERTCEEGKTMTSRTEEWPCKTRASQTVHRNSRQRDGCIQKPCTRDCYLSFAYRRLFYTSCVLHPRPCRSDGVHSFQWMPRKVFTIAFFFATLATDTAPWSRAMYSMQSILVFSLWRNCLE